MLSNDKELYHNPNNSGFTRNCFVCVKPTNKKSPPVTKVEILPTIDVLNRYCETRGNKWGEEVLSCYLSCNDLVAEDAVYHNKCMTNFRLSVPSENRCGSTTDQILMNNFKCACDWLEDEADSKLYTFNETYCKIKELAERTSCYT